MDEMPRQKKKKRKKKKKSLRFLFSIKLGVI